MYVKRPIYDERMQRFYSPADFKEIFRQHPLDRKFIDWVAEQGFKIVYISDWREGNGAVWWGLRQIALSSHGQDRIVNLTLIHELIHIAVPGNYGNYDQRYEEAIDEIAENYVNDIEFLDYIKRKIPIITK